MTGVYVSSLSLAPDMFQSVLGQGSNQFRPKPLLVSGPSDSVSAALYNDTTHGYPHTSLLRVEADDHGRSNPASHFATAAPDVDH